jgi:hypothetical protein
MDKSALYRSDSDGRHPGGSRTSGQEVSAGLPEIPAFAGMTVGQPTVTIETIQKAGERISTRHDHNLAASLGDWEAMGAQHSRATPLPARRKRPGV